MADKPDRKFRVLLILTLIPVTDFFGANWFYMRNAMGGLGKVGLCALFLLILLYFLLAKPGLGAIGLYLLGLLALATIVIWWIVDIFLVAFQKRL